MIAFLRSLPDSTGTRPRRNRGNTPREMTMNDETQFPMTDRIGQLLDEGKEAEARAYAKSAQEAWFAKAKQGHLMNLSDLLASGEAFHVHEFDKKQKHN